MTEAYQSQQGSEIQEVASKIADEWGDILLNFDDPESMLRVAIDSAIQERIVDYALRYVEGRAEEVAERAAEAAIDSWVERGEFSLAIPDKTIARKIERIFIASESWDENVLCAAKKKLAQIHRMSMTEGVDASDISARFGVSDREAERLIKAARDQANAALDMYRAFWPPTKRTK